MKPYYYAYRINGSVPRTRYTTSAEAEAEALRIALRHPGVPVEILKCVAVASTSEATIFRMDDDAPSPLQDALDAANDLLAIQTTVINEMQSELAERAESVPTANKLTPREKLA